MNEKTVLFYGTPGHPVLEPLYQHLRSRGRRRVVFLTQEKFPRDIGLCLGAGQGDPSGWLHPPYEDPVDLDDVCAVCLDGYYVDGGAFPDLDEADAAYAQTEIWATLIALFARLARRPDCVVANHVTRRERVASRAARLAYLSTCGLYVPHTLVTSDPASARAFYEAYGERTRYKPATTPLPEFAAMTSDDLERLDALTLAPIHFEEAVEGELVHHVIVGGRAYPLGRALPDDITTRLIDACGRLDLEMAEVTARVGDEVVITGLHPHLGLDVLQYAEVLEAAATLLEEGRS